MDIRENIFKLEDITEYQKDSIVSRTLLSMNSGTITIFSFDEGQGLSEHTAPFDAFVYIVDGEVEIIISGKSYKLKKGEMIIMPANKPHSVRAIRKFKMLLVMIKG